MAGPCWKRQGNMKYLRMGKVESGRDERGEIVFQLHGMTEQMLEL